MRLWRKLPYLIFCLTKSYKSILFDLDGTLLDSAPDLIFATKRLLQEENKPPPSDDVLRPHISDGAAGLIKSAFGAQSDETLHGRRQKFLNYYRQDPLSQGSQIFAGLEVISELLRNIPWGIVTNKSRPLTEPIIKSLTALQGLSVLVCGDDLQQMKPHPMPVTHACNELNIAPDEVLFVGDSSKDIQSGNSAGTATLAVLYGYRAADDNPYDWGADYYAESPESLIDLIKGFV